MLVFQKIWCALFSCYLLFKIRPFGLSPTNCLWALLLAFSMILRFSEVWKAIHFHVFLPSVIAVTTTVSPYFHIYHSLLKQSSDLLKIIFQSTELVSQSYQI